MVFFGMRAGTRGASSFCFSIHACQSSHHEPGFCVAPSSHFSAVWGSASLVQKWYFFAAGGLTIPAMWPEPPSTKRTGLLRYFAPLYVVFHGAMWSSTVEMKYEGSVTLERSIGTPSSSMPPGTPIKFLMYMLRR